MGKGSEWKKIHDLKTYLIYRRIKEDEDKNKLCEELAEDKDFKGYINLYSIILKIENYRYIDTNALKGCKGYSRQSKSVYDEYKDQSIQKIKEAILHEDSHNQSRSA